MKDKIYYYDRNGALKLTLNQWPYYSEPSDLKNWGWSFSEIYGRLCDPYRKRREYQLVVGIATEGRGARDALCDVFSADMIAGKPGKLVLRGWEIDCFVSEVAYEYGWSIERQATFKVTATEGAWTRRKTIMISGSSTTPGSEDLGRDYIYADDLMGRGYLYGYSMPESNYTEIDLHGEGNGYEITIYGPVSDPVVHLDNRPVRVYIDVGEGERLVITSNGDAKTIRLIALDGSERDAFIYRDKENTPFLEIGEHTELTYGPMRFDFTSIERRSEPSWI